MVTMEMYIYRMGTMETAVGLGTMLGPGCAGLAELAGYYLPYLVLGLLPILPAAVATVTMPTQTSTESKETVSILKLLRIPGVSLMLFAMILISGLPLMIDPTLAAHLKSYKLSLSLVGFVFLICPVLFTGLSPIVGKLAGCLDTKLAFMVFGTFGMGVSFLFLGPSALLGLTHYQHLWPTLVSLGTLGFFWAFAMVPIYDRVIVYATYARPDIDSECLMTVLGSLMWMSMSTGELVCPILGGTLLEAFGFSWAMSVAGCISLFIGIVLMFTLIMLGNGDITFKRFCGMSIEESSEKEALLASHQDNRNNISTPFKDGFRSLGPESYADVEAR